MEDNYKNFRPLKKFHHNVFESRFFKNIKTVRNIKNLFSLIYTIFKASDEKDRMFA